MKLPLMERPTTFNTATGMGVNFSIPVSNITGKREDSIYKNSLFNYCLRVILFSTSQHNRYHRRL